MKRTQANMLLALSLQADECADDLQGTIVNGLAELSIAHSPLHSAVRCRHQAVPGQNGPIIGSVFTRTSIVSWTTITSTSPRRTQ